MATAMVHDLNKEPVIAVDDLVVRYGSVPVNQPISFQLCPGELGLITGDNGSGKTSVLRALLGQGVSHEGRISIFGQGEVKTKPWLLVRRGFRVIPQFPVLPRSLTVKEYMKVWIRRHSEAPRRFDKKSCDISYFERQLSRMFGVDKRAQIATLSTGQRRLLEIFLAFSAEPRVLLADEPLAGIAKTFIPFLADHVQRLLAGSGAVLMVSHRSQAHHWPADWIKEVTTARCSK